MALITNAALSEIKLKAEEMWADGQQASQYAVQAEAVKAIKKEQTALIEELNGSPEKDFQVAVSWLNNCAATDAACPADFCDFTGTAVDTAKKTYALNLCRTASFAVDDNDIAGSIYGKDEVVVKTMMHRMKLLDEYLAKQSLIFLNANAGTNLAPGGYTFDAPTLTTQIPSAEYKSTIVPVWEQMAIKNRIANPYLIDNGELFVDFRNAQFNSGNDNGKGDAARYGAVRLYFDQFNFTAAAITPDDTFMVAKDACAVHTRNFNPDVPTAYDLENGKQTRYTVASANIPGVKYDVYYKMKCSGKRVSHHWLFAVTAGFFLNPEGCAAGNTGILSFSKV